MILGTQVIDELRRRRVAGYFTYRQYQALRKVETLDELRRFAVEVGRGEIGEFDDARAFVEALKEDDLADRESGALGFLAVLGLLMADLAFLGLPTLVLSMGRSIRSTHWGHH